MKLVSVIGGKQFNLEIVEDAEREGAFIVTLDGERIPVDVVELKPTSITMGIDGKVGFFEFTRRHGKLAEMNMGNQSFPAEVKTPQEEQLKQLLEKYARDGAGPSAQKRITAPMPGKILDIYVKPGDKVNLGAVVAVLEAMKMENELTSTVAGVVKNVAVTQGEIVPRDALLIEFV
jgi:biotin carboxyl carrier protein